MYREEFSSDASRDPSFLYPRGQNSGQFQRVTNSEKSERKNESPIERSRQILQSVVRDRFGRPRAQIDDERRERAAKMTRKDCQGREEIVHFPRIFSGRIGGGISSLAANGARPRQRTDV